MRGSIERRQRIKDHLHRKGGQKYGQTSFVLKGLHKGSVLQLAQDLNRNAASDINTARGQKFERYISGLRSVNGHEEIQSLLAHRVAAFKRRLRGRGGRVAIGERGPQSLGFLCLGVHPEKGIEVHEPWPR